MPCMRGGSRQEVLKVVGCSGDSRVRQLLSRRHQSAFPSIGDAGPYTIGVSCTKLVHCLRNPVFVSLELWTERLVVLPDVSVSPVEQVLVVVQLGFEKRFP
jgi:hypothetical protein